MKETLSELEVFKSRYPKIIVWDDSQFASEQAAIKGRQHDAMAKLSEQIFGGKDCFSGGQYWRLNAIDLFEKMLGRKICGKCLEIGAGKGLATAYLSTKKTVDSIYSLDYSLPSLENLQPVAHMHFDGTIPEKIFRVYGSFDDIKVKDLDFIFGFGAIHNSMNLGSTFRSIYESLADGGFFVSSDMGLPISITSTGEDFLADRVVHDAKNRFGVELKYKDTGDHFRSVIEYIHAAKNAGFVVYPYVFSRAGIKKRIRTLEDVFDYPGLPSFFPFGARGRFDRLFLILKKDSSATGIESDRDSNDMYYGMGYAIFLWSRLKRDPRHFVKTLVRKFKQGA